MLAGSWTEVCVAMPALCAHSTKATRSYVVTDACGGMSTEAHERSVQRMVRAGVQPMTWSAYLLELQRDWARARTASRVGDIARAHAGAYGLGAEYIYEMLEWDRAER